jgi:hypothetical protein
MRSHFQIRILAVLAIILLTAQSASATASKISPRKPTPPMIIGIMPIALTSTVIHVPGDTNNIQNAINLIPNGGIIELSGGTYPAPDGGFRVSNLGKGFTIRSADGQEAIFDGGGSREIFRLMNTDISKGKPVIFEGITFQSGYSTDPAIAGGATMYHAQATFINCTFKNNSADSKGEGGGTLVALESTVHFFNTSWLNNSAVNYGGGLAVENNSKVYINYSQFIGNRTNLPNHSPYAAGGGIHVLNSTLRVSNTRFQDNQAGYVGGGLYALGTWSNPVTTPNSDVIVVNSTFVNNQALRDPSVNQTFPTEGGAIHAENQTLLRIFNSRFITNQAAIGGGVNSYRARVEIYQSVFRGNRANGTVSESSFGGSIAVSSNDGPDDGTNNRLPGQLTVINTLIQGRYASVTTVAQNGGCILVGGDGTRIDGNPTVPDMGTVAENRAKVILKNVVLTGCDAQATPPNSGTGGALEVSVADLTMEDSIIMDSNALGANASGGGVVILFHSVANITRSTFAHNTSGSYGGGIFVQGSEINLSESNLFENEVSPGVAETDSHSYGAALFTTPDDSRKLPVTGTIANNIFSNNIGLAVFDDDRNNGPINDVRYNNNQFFETIFGSKVYRDSLSNALTVANLNSLVITRSNGTTTPKSQIKNIALSKSPSVGSVLAAPPVLLATNAPGDAPAPTSSFLGYAWTGLSATLNNNQLNTHTGVMQYSSSGNYRLSVDGNSYSTSITQSPLPSATFLFSSSNSTLDWSLVAGTFLDDSIDQGVSFNPAPSGSVTVSAAEYKTYYLYMLTQQGGVVKTARTGLPILAVPDSFFVLTKPNQKVQRIATISNDGGGVLDWNAQSETPSLIQVNTPTGQTIDQTELIYSVDTSGLTLGNYTGKILIRDSNGISKEITIYVKVVARIFSTFLPLTDH